MVDDTFTFNLLFNEITRNWRVPWNALPWASFIDSNLDYRDVAEVQRHSRYQMQFRGFQFQSHLPLEQYSFVNIFGSFANSCWAHKNFLLKKKRKDMKKRWEGKPVCEFLYDFAKRDPAIFLRRTQINYIEICETLKHPAVRRWTLNSLNIEAFSQCLLKQIRK